MDAPDDLPANTALDRPATDPGAAVLDARVDRDSQPPAARPSHPARVPDPALEAVTRLPTVPRAGGVACGPGVPTARPAVGSDRVPLARPHPDVVMPGDRPGPDPGPGGLPVPG